MIVASTIPAFQVTSQGHWWHWLENAEQIRECASCEVGFFAALQRDERGPEPFRSLVERLANVAGEVHWFDLDLGDEEWTTGNRTTGVCIGRNLAIAHAQRMQADWIYFADSDISAPDDILPRLLELDWPVCGGHVPTYRLDGPGASKIASGTDPLAAWWTRNVRRLAGVDVRVHWNTAGSLLVHRDVFRRVPWRWDPHAGDTDDPATQKEMKRIGYPALVRHDVICRHNPELISVFEDRGFDRRVRGHMV